MKPLKPMNPCYEGEGCDSLKSGGCACRIEPTSDAPIGAMSSAPEDMTPTKVEHHVLVQCLAAESLELQGFSGLNKGRSTVVTPTGIEPMSAA
jgi:hypothetical protein